MAETMVLPQPVATHEPAPSSPTVEASKPAAPDTTEPATVTPDDTSTAPAEGPAAPEVTANREISKETQIAELGKITKTLESDVNRQIATAKSLGGGGEAGEAEALKLLKSDDAAEKPRAAMRFGLSVSYEIRDGAILGPEGNPVGFHEEPIALPNREGAEVVTIASFKDGSYECLLKDGTAIQVPQDELADAQLVSKKDDILGGLVGPQKEAMELYIASRSGEATEALAGKTPEEVNKLITDSADSLNMLTGKDAETLVRTIEAKRVTELEESMKAKGIKEEDYAKDDEYNQAMQEIVGETTTRLDQLGRGTPGNLLNTEAAATMLIDISGASPENLQQRDEQLTALRRDKATEVQGLQAELAKLEDAAKGGDEIAGKEAEIKRRSLEQLGKEARDIRIEQEVITQSMELLNTDSMAKQLESFNTGADPEARALMKQALQNGEIDPQSLLKVAGQIDERRIMQEIKDKDEQAKAKAESQARNEKRAAVYKKLGWAGGLAGIAAAMMILSALKSGGGGGGGGH